MRKGFTLIELIVVIGIISILAVALVVVVDPLSQFQKANDSRRKSDLAQIQKALETYYQDHARYPAAGASNYKISPYLPSDKNWTGSNLVNWGAPWPYYDRTYMTILPKDPNFPKRRYAYYSPDGQHYYLYASLERGYKDPQVCAGVDVDNPECDNTTSLSLSGYSFICGNYPCNYGVSSPNTKP